MTNPLKTYDIWLFVGIDGGETVKARESYPGSVREHYFQRFLGKIDARDPGAALQTWKDGAAQTVRTSPLV